MKQTYRAFVHDNSPRFAELFHHLLDTDAPMVFHCTAGKDRTGVAAALILLALGVPRDVVLQDYLLTNKHYCHPPLPQSETPIDVLQVLWRVYVPLARPVYVAFALVSVSYHWNNFLWPLVITNSVESRPLTVGLQVFSSTDQGIDWSIITAATLMSAAPLLVAFLLFQRQFVQSFMRAGIK
jgi:hypothetical protein